MTDALSTLTENQKACFRLVGEGMSSKEIAARIGLSPQTVDTYLKVAMARLGASNRRDAARLLVAAERSQDLGSPSPAIVPPGGGAQTVAATGLRREGMSLLPPLGGVSNDLSLASRTYAMLRVAGFSAVTMIAIVLFMAGAFRMLR